MDKSNFTCFQLKDESVYFGEAIYQNEQGQVFDPKQDQEAANKGKPVRHGFGIQLFGTTSDEFLCKYEGYWDKDRMHGICRCWFPDKSTYEGHMKYNVKEGAGKFKWANGDEYDGIWRNNRFEGAGTFRHNSGNVLSGIFKNNYFMRANDQFINPFLSGEEIDQFIKRKNEINLLKEKNKKQKLFFFEKVNKIEDLAQLIKKSNQNNRIPLIFSSKQLGASINEIFNQIQQLDKRSWYDFDLRQAFYLKKQNVQQLKQYMAKTKKNLSNVLVKGETFVVNLDDSASAQYDEIFYPDIREFYNSSSFPSQIWNIEYLNRHEVFEKIIADTENFLKMVVSNDFTLAVWSKYKIDDSVDNKKIIEKIERRFSSIIPMIKIDLIMITQ
ncbi:hypothetical protein ABPG72_004085 [Tetrahymena utriculariae]